MHCESLTECQLSISACKGTFCKKNFVNILKATEFVSENLITLLNFVISNTVLTFTHYFGYSSERKHRNVCSALCVRAVQNWNVSLGLQTYKSTNLCPVIVYYRL